MMHCSKPTRCSSSRRSAPRRDDRMIARMSRPAPCSTVTLRCFASPVSPAGEASATTLVLPVARSSGAVDPAAVRRSRRVPPSPRVSSMTLCCVQQRLRGYAADVEADPAELGQRSTSATLRGRGRPHGMLPCIRPVPRRYTTSSSNASYVTVGASGFGDACAGALPAWQCGVRGVLSGRCEIRTVPPHRPAPDCRVRRLGRHCVAAVHPQSFVPRWRLVARLDQALRSRRLPATVRPSTPCRSRA